MRTIYRHAYKVKIKAPQYNWQNRWEYEEWRRKIAEAEAWCYDHAKRDWSHREGECEIFWFENGQDATMFKLIFT